MNVNIASFNCIFCVISIYVLKVVVLDKTKHFLDLLLTVYEKIRIEQINSRISLASPSMDLYMYNPT